jgi:hypothetical protein
VEAFSNKQVSQGRTKNGTTCSNKTTLARYFKDHTKRIRNTFELSISSCYLILLKSHSSKLVLAFEKVKLQR